MGIVDLGVKKFKSCPMLCEMILAQDKAGRVAAAGMVHHPCIRQECKLWSEKSEECTILVTLERVGHGNVADPAAGETGKRPVEGIADGVGEDRASEAGGQGTGKAHGSPRTIVCLCGSLKFLAAYEKAMLDETLRGKIVLTVGCTSKNDDQLGISPTVKAFVLDPLHLDKIALADEVLILDVNGYMGESTRSELAHAEKLGKKIRFWSQEHGSRRETTQEGDVE